jgi:biotin operon repressor
MDNGGAKSGIRRMDSGSWYWISKEIIQNFVRETGFLAMCVYHFLASMVDENQRCYPSQQYIAKHLGCSRAAVNVAIGRLKRIGLLDANKAGGKYCSYQLLETKCQPEKTHVSTTINKEVNRSDTNNNQLTRNNNNTFVCVETDKHANEQRPVTKEELLASDISETLEDQRNIRQYLFYARRYPESVLREFLSQAKQTPSHRIKKSRAALFAYLVKQYDQQTS